MAERKKPQPNIEDDGSDQVTTKMESLNVNIASGSNIPESSVKIKESNVTFISLPEKEVLAVLQYLEPLDLVNVAQTNRFLKNCADSTILNCYERFVNPMKINNPNNKFFRQFGHLARELIVNCSKIKKPDWNKMKLHILPAIADRCESKLKSLRLEYVSENLSTLNKEDSEKVRILFSRVNKLYIMDGCLYGWEKLMKNARIKLDVLSLEFYKTDFLEEYVRKYQGLKSLHMSGFFSPQLFDLNPTIQSVNYHSDSVSKTRLKHLSRLPLLKNLSIIIMGHARDCNIISSDFSTLLSISTLKYLYLMSTNFDPMKATAYISTLLSLQHHEKLIEFHFFCQFVGPFSTHIKFKENAFPNLKQLSIYGNFPFLHAVSQFRTLNDIFIMDSSTYHIEGFEGYHDIITKMPRLQRIIFDVTTDINDGRKDSLVKMCRSRTSQSNLVILVQNSKNNIIQATMYANTILMFSVNQPTVSKKKIVFEDSVGSVFDRARLIAEKGECVAVNYKDFTKGANSVENDAKYN